MTPTEKLMQKVIHAATGEIVHDPADVRRRYLDLGEDPETEDARHDAEAGIRGCGVPTGLPCDYSRHYESKAVAAEMLDGSWVGWTYWYGGGKHGEPSGIPWMEDAYEVETTVVMKPVREFKKVETTLPAEQEVKPNG